MAEVLILSTPIEHGSEKITELYFAEPTAREMMLLNHNPSFGDLLKVTAALTNLPERVIQKLRVRDARLAVEKTVFFAQRWSLHVRDSLAILWRFGGFSPQHMLSMTEREMTWWLEIVEQAWKDYGPKT